MKNIGVFYLSISLLVLASTSPCFSQHEFDIENHRADAQKLINAALSDSTSFQKLTNFVDTFGHRLSGSESLERSIDWIMNELKNGDLENPHTQQVMVPHWVRGKEYARLTSPRQKKLPMLGLGNSISTPPEGIEAQVLVVTSFNDLANKADEAKGKIVLYDVPFTTYGETVRYRVSGAVEAAKAGAVASLVRSVSPYSMKTPHTGNSHYQEGVEKIPHAAITTEDASLLHRMQNRGKGVSVELYMEAKTLPDAESRNILAEIEGSENPEEIVVLGGHIDSWDVGQGVMDDAGGSFAAWEALKLMIELGLRPRRTVRLVMWTNEENGLRGAIKYRDVMKENETLQRHVVAIESDSGIFTPLGFGFSGSDAAYKMVQQIAYLLKPLEANEITRGGGGADIRPLIEENIPGMGLRVNGSRYFWYHHTAADTIDKLTEEDYKKCIATMAVMAYTVANLKQTLPK